MDSQNITKLPNFWANWKLTMYIRNPNLCIVLIELARLLKIAPYPPSRPTCAPTAAIFLATSPAIFRPPTATTFSPQHSLTPPPTTPLNTPQHLHHHGQPQKGSQEVLRRPKIATAMFVHAMRLDVFPTVLSPIDGHQQPPTPSGNLSLPWAPIIKPPLSPSQLHVRAKWGIKPFLDLEIYWVFWVWFSYDYY